MGAGIAAGPFTESEACQAIDRRQREFIKHVHAPHALGCCFERKTPGDKTCSKSQRDADMLWNTGRQSRFSCQAPVKIKDAEKGWTERTHEQPHIRDTGLDERSSGLNSRHTLSFWVRIQSNTIKYFHTERNKNYPFLGTHLCQAQQVFKPGFPLTLRVRET